MDWGEGRIAGRTVAMVAPAVLLVLTAAGRARAADVPGASIAVAAKANGKAKGHHHPRYLHATIRRTKYGIPHIRAKNIESVAAGYAFAFAHDDICTIANEYVTVSGERSRRTSGSRRV